MNSMIFEEVTQSDPISFAFITLPIKQRRIVPSTGCVDVPEYSFNEVFDQFKVRRALSIVYCSLLLFVFSFFKVYLSTNIKTCN